MGHLQRMVNLEMLRHAVAGAMFCPLGRDALDVRSAVLIDAIDHGGGSAVVCGEHWDHNKARIVTAVLAATPQRPGAGDFDVIDGRELRQKRRPRQSKPGVMN